MITLCAPLFWPHFIPSDRLHSVRYENCEHTGKHQCYKASATAGRRKDSWFFIRPIIRKAQAAGKSPAVGLASPPSSSPPHGQPPAKAEAKEEREAPEEEEEEEEECMVLPPLPFEDEVEEERVWPSAEMQLQATERAPAGWGAGRWEVRARRRWDRWDRWEVRARRSMATGGWVLLCCLHRSGTPPLSSALKGQTVQQAAAFMQCEQTHRLHPCNQT